MRFLLDQNVAKAVLDVIRELGHEAEYSRALIPPTADDPVVALAAEETDSILISHDNDFKTIAPRVVQGQRARFRKLSRIALQCSEVIAAQRVREMMPIIEILVRQAASRPDKRVIIFIQKYTHRTS